MARAAATLYFERGIWAEAAFRYWQKLPLIVLIVTAQSAIDLYNALKAEHSGFLSSLIWSVLAASVHNSLLNGSNALFPKTIYVLGVAGSWLALTIPGGFAMVIAALYLGSDELRAPIPYAIFVIITLFFASFFGTMLPAAVKGRDDQAFGKVAARGKLVFSYTFTRLIIWTCALVAANYAFDAATTLLSQSTSEHATAAGTLSPVNIAITLVSSTVGAYFFVLLAVILSRSYMVSERQIGELRRDT